MQDIDSKIVEAQLDAIFTDICVDAVKIGMLSDSKIIHVVAEKLKFYKPKIIVLDPVMISKSGHLDGEPVDRLYDGNKIYAFNSERINTKNTHGTGCTLSSAIAANLALGYDIQKAVELSKMYVLSGIKNSIELGHGVGLINHFYELYKKAGLNV